MAKKKQSQTTGNEGEGKTDAEKATGGTDAGSADDVDQRLVEEAVAFVRDAIQRTVERGYNEIGQFVFRRFFGGDLAQLRSKAWNKGASFRALLERCDTLELPLRRSALHNAVAVAAMQHELGAGPIAYKQLPYSHQVALLPMRDPKKVEKLASKALTRKLPVRALKEEVAEERASTAPQGEKRGRKPDPKLLKALKAAAIPFTVDGSLLPITRAQVEELSDDQKAAALALAEQLQALCEGVVEKLA